MSKISSTDKVVTQAQLKEDLQNFYEQIRPFLNGEPGMNLDSTPTQNSTNGATSGGIYTALSGKQNTLTAGTGVSISGNTISAPVNYSTTEHVVGTWIDGKPIYEKTISLGSMPNTATVSKSISSTNINIIKSFLYTYRSSDGTFIIWPDTSDNNFFARYVITDYGKNIKLTSNADRSAFNGYLTIQYTKTTD